MLSPFTLEILGAFARWGLTLLTTLLVRHHVLTVDQSDHLTAALVQHLLLWAPAVAALVWGIWAKHTARVKLLFALMLGDHGGTEQEVTNAIKAGAVTPAVSTPANTAPGIPQVP